MVMIAESSTFAPQHVPRESGNPSIQARMRAMANADSQTQVVQQPPGSVEDNNNNTGGIQTGSKRSSVIDMWRQREMSSMSSKNLSKPIPLRKTSSDRGFRHTEEKKEPTLEEDVIDSESHERISAKRFSEPVSGATRRVFLPTTPRAVSPAVSKPEVIVSPSTPAWDKSITRNSWKKEESPLEEGIKGNNGTVAMQYEEENPSTSAMPESVTSWSGAPGNVVHAKWEQENEEPDEPAKISPATSPKLAPVTRAAPVTPENSESPAFSDLKSKWAQFGAHKVQARVGTKGPANVVSPVVHKMTSNNNSQRNTRSVGRGSDESSIDGDVPAGTLGQSNTMDYPSGTSATVLQQPTSQGHDADEASEDAEKTSKRKPSRHETNNPQDEDSPAKKVSTYMYMKGRPNMASRVSRESDNETQDNSTFAPRLNALPKRMLQRKLLMDKQRRRSKGVSGTSNSTTPSISSDEDALNEAFNKTCAENDKFDFSEKRAVANPMRADNPEPMIESRIPIQTLMAFGAAEDEFLAAEPVPRKTTAPSSFNQQQQPQEDEFGYRVSRIADNTNEFESAPSSLPPQSAIAARAQKTLRDKRSRPKPSGGSPERTSVPLKEPNYGGTKAPQGFSEDEMKTLDKEQGGNVPQRASRFIEGSNGPSDEFKLSCGTRFWGGFQEREPSATFDESVSASTTSHMLSLATSASDVTSVKDEQFGTARSRDSLLDGDDLVTDQFVSESNTHAEAFAASFQSLSLAQLANDIKEEAGSVLKGVDFTKLSSNWNEGVAAASQSLGEATSRLNKFVGKDVFAKAKPQPTVPGRAPSPVEEIAIEVEYVEDSDDGEV